MYCLVLRERGERQKKKRDDRGGVLWSFTARLIRKGRDPAEQKFVGELESSHKLEPGAGRKGTGLAQEKVFVRAKNALGCPGREKRGELFHWER